MLIYVDILDTDQRITLDANSTDLISGLYDKVRIEYPQLSLSSFLTFNGTELDRTKDLLYYGIQKNSVLILSKAIQHNVVWPIVLASIVLYICILYVKS